MYFPYAFPKSLYTAPASNAVLGMIANYQSGPAIFKHLNENNGVKTVAFNAANESDPLSQRDGGVAAAKALGLEIVSDSVTYQVDTTDFTPVLTPVMRIRPDLLVLSGVAPANAPQLIRSACELGFTGIILTETVQNAGVLAEVQKHVGVDAVRCLVDVLVIGIGEAAFHAASMIAAKFSVVTTLTRSVAGIGNFTIAAV